MAMAMAVVMVVAMGVGVATEPTMMQEGEFLQHIYCV